MIVLCSKPKDLSFYFSPYGGVKPVEMAVTHILKDDTTGKQFFVFTYKNRSGPYFLREYLGDIKSERFFMVKNKELFGDILKALKDDNLDIDYLKKYVAYDS